MALLFLPTPKKKKEIMETPKITESMKYGTKTKKQKRNRVKRKIRHSQSNHIEIRWKDTNFNLCIVES